MRRGGGEEGRWRKMKTARDVGGGIRQNKEGREERGGKKEEKEKGPLAVALGGTIGHLNHRRS